MKRRRSEQELPRAAPDAAWAAPTARSRLAAVALAVAFAVVTMLLVDRTWHRTAPAARPATASPATVDVTLVPARPVGPASAAATDPVAR